MHSPKIHKVIKQKNLFINLALQLSRDKRLALTPKIDVMYLKIDLYCNTGDEAVLDGLYYYMMDVNSSIQQELVYNELSAKISTLCKIAE
ncbi:hypothetical protein D1Q00_gp031 [Trichoplusia ni granulovirus LBIV-12]|jgi:hypothetical protein|uniref:Uncharacterized protein n=2 Tax=Betabaculovirus TaxID=558017 RepID=A0A1D8QL35_GVTN|nr:hypothetical protein PsunGV_gp034 [Pseudalatia unipuncta granulovirus]YP_009506101.1 hypothetical protein D1Q00_gp031 [Trichoplusia ni granulovirus LBIV-12]ACH69384.1 unknown [Pseudalatia unipuncta granulovirus]AOW41370.1 hypothetical protein [Trichoplusia ni granulovirus LBIV-12]